MCISFTAPSHWQPHIICGRSSAYSACLELRCSCSVPQLNSGGTRYLQWYIDSCFLLGERIMCVESPGICSGLLTAVFCWVRGLCVWSHQESLGICSGTLTVVFCLVRGLCVRSHLESPGICSGMLTAVFCSVRGLCVWSQLESPGICSGTLTAVFCRVRGLCV